MAFSVKDWRDAPSTLTPIDAPALEDLEARLAAYAESLVQQAELLRAEIIANVPFTSNAFADVPGLSITPTCDGGPLEIILFTPFGTNSVAGGNYNQQILMDGTVVGVATVTAPTNGGGAACISIANVQPAAGAHTFKAQMRAGTAGQTATMWAFATSPAFIAARRR